MDTPSNLPIFLLGVWLVLLVIGAPFGLMGTGMTFEGGYTLSAYLFVITIWSYPALIVVAFVSFFLRGRHPALLWLPAVPLFLLGLSAWFNW